MTTATIATAAAAAAASSSENNGFVQDIVVYFLVKIATSLDDVVWLSPFVALAAEDSRHNNNDDEERINVFLIYIAICMLISFGALILAWLANAGLTMMLLLNHENHQDQMNRVLNIVGGLCIALFAFFEWKSGNDNDHDDDEDTSSPTSVADGRCQNDGPTETTSLLEKGLAAAETTTQETDSTVAAAGEEPSVHQHSAQDRRHLLVDLFVVGIFGQLDTLAVFFSVLVSRTPIRVVPVVIGSLLAAAVIILFAYLVTLFKPLTRCLEKVPLWALLAVIAFYVLLQGVVNF